MSSILGSLFVELKANTAQFVGDLGNASKAAKTAANDISREFSSLQRVASQTFGAFGSFNPVVSQFSFLLSQTAREAAGAATSFGAIGAVATGAAGAFATLGIGAITVAARTADSNAKLYEQAQRAGVSVEALSRLSYAAKQVGVDQEVLVRSLDFMSKAAFTSTLGNNQQAKAFKDLGISVLGTNGAFKPADELFAEVAGKLSTMTDQTKRAALEMTIFGRGGAELAPLMNLGIEAIERLFKELDKMGGTVTTQAGKAAEQYKQNLSKLGTEIDALAQRLTSTLLPAMIAVTDKMANFSFTFPTSPRIESFGKFATAAAPLGSRTNPDITATMGSPGNAPFTEDQIAGQKRIGEEIDKVIAKYKETAATIGMTAAQTEDWRLKTEGATKAQIALADAARSAAEAAQIKRMPMSAPIVPDKSKILSTDNGRLVDQLQEENLQLDRQRSSLDSIMDAAQQAQSAGLGPLVGTLGSDADAAKDAKTAFDALSETLNKEIANHGKSDIEQQIEAFEKLPGARSADIASLQQLDAQLKALDADTEKASGVWKQFGNDISRTFADIATGAEKPRKAFLQLVKQIDEMLIKQAIFGQGAGHSGSGGLFGSLGGVFGGNKATTPPFLAGGTSTGPGSATGGFLSTLGRVFGLGGKSSSAGSSAIVRDGNTTGSSIYVTPVDLAGTVIDAQDQSSAIGNAIGDPNAAIPTLSSTLKSLTQLPKSAGDDDVGLSGSLGGIGGALLKLIPGFAGGGSMDAGSMAIVGENGPELWAPDTAGKVVPMSAGSSGGGVHYNIDARGATDPAATAMAVRHAIRQSENRAVARSQALTQQNRLRTPASVAS